MTTSKPSSFSTSIPTILSTKSSTVKPTNPTSQPSSFPSGAPSLQITDQPSNQPSISPTNQPTLIPTLSPTCSANRTCPLDTYIQMAGDCTDCIICSFPYATNVENSRTCSAVNLNVSNFWLIIILSTLGFMFICMLISAKNDLPKAFQVTLFPVIDVNSDLIYILTTPFYNVTLFYFAVIFYLLSNSVFIYHVFTKHQQYT
jgi:hypothetical protein